MSLANAQRPIMIMAGGTGGHVYPGLAVADELLARGHTVIWLGSEQSFEERVVPLRGLPFHALAVKGVRGKGWFGKISGLVKAAGAAFSARRLLKKLRPKAVISFGGFAAAPGGIAAASLRYPLFVHEQNRIPGLTNKVLARFARAVLAGFPDSFEASSKLHFVGNPVRTAIVQLLAPEQRFAERQGAIRLLVLGGSLGAQAINQTLPAALALMPANARPEVWHQSGAKLFEAAKAAYQAAGINVKLMPFIDDMAEAYGWADVVLCRAGASTIAELTAAGLGALFVPFPFAVDDHQTANARWLVDQQAAKLCPQQELSAERLAKELANLSDRALCLSMAKAARNLAKTEAAKLVANLLEQA